ncbi:hypothetical protein BDF20DRAFT_911051 [Mycotypha africana]|uniref:uncharacterized protein n=1 Tax=Mycotypha africana TaxID=64632 RepID=UPI0023008D46|nr:uncharacterized protein BDF20DRAFT_911051 [Mycotypha africana]KAI8988601.1 hypothetical protein BDF20DRAFT_911051 [Mycotypha africana]
MKLLSLLLGQYNDNQEFNLYRAENSSTLLFKFADLCFLFGLAADLLDTSQDATIYLDKRTSDIYVTTNDLVTLAVKHNKFLLAELCKLKISDYATHLDESILSNLPRLKYYSPKKDEGQFKASHIEVYNAKTKVKSEPISPRPPMILNASDPMALNNIMSGSGSQQLQQNQQQLPVNRRLSRTFEEDQQTNKRQKKGHEEFSPILPKPLHTVSSQKMPTLLAKRLGTNNNTSSSHNKNTRNLTIYAPSYGEQFQNSSIKSAPLNQSYFRQQVHNRYYQQQSHHHQPHPLSQATLISPATSTTTNTPTTANTTTMTTNPVTDFAVPPIVPSQHQPPHTAHPGSIHHPHHPFPPQSPQYSSSAFIHGHGYPHHYHPLHPPPTAPLPPPSFTSNSNNTPASNNKLQKQQFMQPFEHLFDTIESTRTLKSTLDDQIRRSSTLIQTLQASSSTIEGLIKNQIKEVQKEVVHRMETSVDKLFRRINALEKRMQTGIYDTMETENGNSMEVVEEEAKNTEGSVTVEDNKKTISESSPSNFKQQQAQIRDLVNPPTIVKSQNDIGPNEYRHMLDILRERLDKLERQLGS